MPRLPPAPMIRHWKEAAGNGVCSWSLGVSAWNTNTDGTTAPAGTRVGFAGRLSTTVTGTTASVSADATGERATELSSTATRTTRRTNARTAPPDDRAARGGYPDQSDSWDHA